MSCGLFFFSPLSLSFGWISFSLHFPFFNILNICLCFILSLFLSFYFCLPSVPLPHYRARPVPPTYRLSLSGSARSGRIGSPWSTRPLAQRVPCLTESRTSNGRLFTLSGLGPAFSEARTEYSLFCWLLPGQVLISVAVSPLTLPTPCIDLLARWYESIEL